MLSDVLQGAKSHNTLGDRALLALNVHESDNKLSCEQSLAMAGLAPALEWSICAENALSVSSIVKSEISAFLQPVCNSSVKSSAHSSLTCWARDLRPKCIIGLSAAIC